MSTFGQPPNKAGKIRFAVVGLVHTHVHWILSRPNTDAYELVGIYEPNQELAASYARQHGYSMSIVFTSMEDMVSKTKPDAVLAFNTIRSHLSTVAYCAPRGIHVMVEKPLAVSLDHAREMAALAQKHRIHLLTNYETSWYPTNHEIFSRSKNGEIGSIRKIIVRDGHRGPAKIGINKEFLQWLTDPVENGAGALMDFGCYGANLSTWLLEGKRPLSVTAVTQQLQPGAHPKVDDEATLILAYDTAQALIQASWNWPIGRKDLEVYGLTGVFYSDNRNDMRIRIPKGYDGFDEIKRTLPELNPPYHDPFLYFASIIRGQIHEPRYGLYSLDNNLLVMEILEAAKQSALSGRTVTLKPEGK